MTDTKLIAIHEAGHAIAHLINKVPFISASIVKQGQSLGRLNVNGTAVSPFIFATICAAGSIAEKMHQGTIRKEITSGRFTVNGDDGKDFGQAIASIIEDKDEAAPLTSWLVVRTYHQLAKRWRVLLTIAAILQEKGELTHQECEAIVAACKLGI